MGSLEIQRWRQRSGLSRSIQRPLCKDPNRHEDRDRPPRSSCFRRHMDLSYFRSRPKGTRTRDTNKPNLRQIPRRLPTTWVFAALVSIESSLIVALVFWGEDFDYEVVYPLYRAKGKQEENNRYSKLRDNGENPQRQNDPEHIPKRIAYLTSMKGYT